MIAFTDFVDGLQKYFESCNTASTKRKIVIVNLLVHWTDMTVITSLNMHAINCRCSPTRVTQQFHIIQHSQAHAY